MFDWMKFFLAKLTSVFAWAIKLAWRSSKWSLAAIQSVVLIPHTSFDKRQLAAGAPLPTVEMLLISAIRAFTLVTLLSLVLPAICLPISPVGQSSHRLFSSNTEGTTVLHPPSHLGDRYQLEIDDLSKDEFCVVARPFVDSAGSTEYLGLMRPKASQGGDINDWQVIYRIIYRQSFSWKLAWRDWQVRVEVYAPLEKATISNLRSEVFEEVHWQQIGNVSESPLIAQLNPVLWSCRRPSYPASVTSVCSWLRTHWKGELLNRDSPIDGLPNEKTFSTNAIGPLERAIQADWGDTSTRVPLVLLRMSSGPIQIAILSVALCIVSLNLCRKEVFCQRVMECRLRLAKQSGEGNRAPARNRAREILTDNEQGMNQQVQLDPTALDILRVIKAAFSKNSAKPPSGFSIERLLGQIEKRGETWPALLKRRVDNAISTRLASRRMIDWLSGALPILGFLGTVIGMSMTIGNASSMLAEEFGRQQSELSHLTLKLAVAFDTTLYGILAMLLTGFYSVTVSIDEEQSVRSLATSIEHLASSTKSNSSE